MGKIIEAVYGEGVFRPKEPVSLREGDTVRVLLPEEEVHAPAKRDERLRRHFGAWRSGNPDSASNDRIDADLAR